MEYYDDKYRKSIAPEFDIRIKDESILKSQISSNIKLMWEKYFNLLAGDNFTSIKENTDFSLKILDYIFDSL